mmetsp:Transcript_94259/g.224416  ORF Transcript_94259/g.224416 Transcript_94259/m.224416 type:complete len:248 (+) Transcript_94259:5196-5939(+)
MLGACGHLAHGGIAPLRFRIVVRKPNLRGGEAIRPGANAQGTIAAEAPGKQAPGVHDAATDDVHNGKGVISSAADPLHCDLKVPLKVELHLRHLRQAALRRFAMAQLSVGVVATGQQPSLCQDMLPGVPVRRRLQILQDGGVVAAAGHLHQVPGRLCLPLATLSLLKRTRGALKDSIHLLSLPLLVSMSPQAQRVVPVVAPAQDVSPFLPVLLGSHQQQGVRAPAGHLPRLGLGGQRGPLEHQHPLT